MSPAAQATAVAPGRADQWIRRTGTVTVAGLAGIAGALSYSHMRQLAEAHGQAGWHVHTLPLSVDGVEIVASLVLLADRRTGRRSGWLPWAALIIGTAASLAANIATAQPDPISRLIAGWPALALLITVKLLSGMLEHRDTATRPPVPTAVPCGDGPGPATPGRPALAATVPVPPGPDRPAQRRDGYRPPPRHDATRPATSSRHPGTPRPGPSPASAGTVPASTADLAALLPAARAARDDLYRDGHPLTRDSLAARLRQAGHPVRNARLTPLLHTLRAEAAAPSPATT